MKPQPIRQNTFDSARRVAAESAFPQNDSTYNNVIDVPKERTQLLNAIILLRTLEDDWNGHGALRPHPKALDTAQKFITLFPFGKSFPNKIYPGPDRSVVMEWTGKNEEGDILITIVPYLLGAVKVYTANRFEDLGDYDLLPGVASFPQPIREFLPSE